MLILGRELGEDLNGRRLLKTAAFASKRRWLMLLLVAAGAAVAFQQLAWREPAPVTMSLPALKQLAETSPSDPLVHLVYGERLERANDTKAAIQEFQRAEKMLEMGQHDVLAERINSRLGYALAFMGDGETARRYLDRAHRINRDNWLVTVAEATLLIHEREAKRAVGLCRRAVVLRPEG